MGQINKCKQQFWREGFRVLMAMVQYGEVICNFSLLGQAVLNSYLVFVMRVEGDMDMFIQKEKKSTRKTNLIYCLLGWYA